LARIGDDGRVDFTRAAAKGVVSMLAKGRVDQAIAVAVLGR